MSSKKKWIFTEISCDIRKRMQKHFIKILTGILRHITWVTITEYKV